MANKNILTTGAKVSEVTQYYYAPVSIISNTDRIVQSMYCFLARAETWPDDNNPPQPTQSDQYLKNVFKNIFVTKRITTADISPVIQRIDWVSGEVYDYYDDALDMLEVDSNGYLIRNFYVRNHYNQVFKCLWNNSSLINNEIVGQPSTDEPYFQPGSYGTNNIFTGSDGYKWKYIYTIDTGNKTKFMDASWMPVSVSSRIPGPKYNESGDQIGVWSGNIDTINILDGGSNYNPVNSVITITITGDGTGATATAEANSISGKIENIIITNTGSNYTYANVAITSAEGSGCVTIIPISPVGGHGYDPISELGCMNVMVTCEFNDTESYQGTDYVPDSIDYHQVGLLVNPISESSYPYAANGTIYKTTTDLLVSGGEGAYTQDEIVYQSDASGVVYFTGRVLYFNNSTNIINLLNISGSPVLNQSLIGSGTTTARVLLSVSNPILKLPSGYITYIENRSAVQRSNGGIEQFKFVLKY